MRLVCAVLAMQVVVVLSQAVIAQQPVPGQSASPQLPGQPAPQPGTQPTTPVPPPVPQPRTFSAPVGLLFNTVRIDRVDDFEKAMGSLQAALASSTNERVRAQAKGWRIFKAVEPGPGGAALYVFVIDPTVEGADYSLGRILADAYPDQAQLQEIWKLYSAAISGASLLNLTPLKTAPAVQPAPAP